jgi:hypothetical protein
VPHGGCAAVYHREGFVEVTAQIHTIVIERFVVHQVTGSDIGGDQARGRRAAGRQHGN